MAMFQAARVGELGMCCFLWEHTVQHKAARPTARSTAGQRRNSDVSRLLARSPQRVVKVVVL